MTKLGEKKHWQKYYDINNKQLVKGFVQNHNKEMLSYLHNKPNSYMPPSPPPQKKDILNTTPSKKN